MKNEILRLEHIGKIAHKQLLNNISLNLYQSEALCVVTEDLDAKLFLLDLLQGNAPHEHGRLYLYDRVTVLHSQEESRNLGLYFAMENKLIPSMNVAHNLFMTDRSFYFCSVINNRAMHKSAQDLLACFSLEHIKTTALVHSLSNLDCYLLSVLHAVASGAKIIILDTPYSIYQPTEIKRIQHVVSVLREKGLSVLWFTNKWDPLFQNFDRFAMIKNGAVTQITQLTQIPPLTFPPHFFQPLSSLGENSNIVLEYKRTSDINNMIPGSDHFVLKEGEILGICGSDTHLEAMISRMLEGKKIRAEEFLLYGVPYAINFSQKNQIAFIYATEDKLRVFPKMNLYDNVTLLLNKPMYNQLGFMNTRIRNHIVNSMLKSIHGEYLISAFSDKSTLKDMNSLDRLKVEIAKWLCVYPKVFIFVNPHNIYDNLTESDFSSLLDDLHNLGISILILSASEENLSRICTRVISIPEE